MRSGSALPVDLRPRRDALDLVMAVWSRQGSGSFQRGDARSAVREGEPLDMGSLLWIGRALCEPALRFDEGAAPLASDRAAPLGPTLLDAGERLGDLRALRQATETPIVGGPLGHALSRLPLRPNTRRLVRAALGTPAPLGRVLASHGLALDEIEHDLCALVALGVLRSGGLVAPRLRGPQADPDDAALAATTERRMLSQRRLRSRLEQDRAALDAADDWTVLGLSPGASRDQLQRGAARMRARYATVSVELEDEGGRQALDALQRRVEGAIRRLGAPDSQSNSSSEGHVPGPEQALALGQEAASRGQLGQARRWMGLAWRQDPDSARVLAWYGWTLLVDPRSFGAASQQRGRSLVERALALAPTDPEVLHRAVEAAVQLADGRSARAWVARLQAIAPEHPGLPSLVRRVGRL